MQFKISRSELSFVSNIFDTDLKEKLWISHNKVNKCSATEAAIAKKDKNSLQHQR